MKNKKIIQLFFLFISLSIFCQEKDINSDYIKYFENTREIPHLHLNKTSFLKGEEVWFQAYVLEQNSGKPHPTTSNLYLSIFEENGKLKNQHLIKIENGIGRGNFLIDSTFINNNYYLKASTNWMKNFEEDQAFYQKIKIIATTESAEKTETLNEDDFFDFQLFPESGHYLANTKNTVGVLIKDAKNKGIKIVKGVIKNTDNKIITTFKTNKFGLGKVSFFINKDKNYTVEAELPNGSIVKKSIEKIRNVGVLLKVLPKKENFEIIVETNTSTLKLLENKTYKILIHNTRKYKFLVVNFNNQNNKYILQVDKKELFNGINIITLFNEDEKPISERLIFNDAKDIFTSITVDKKELNKDSVLVKINNKNNEKLFLSASILSKNTKAYQATNSIRTSFLLKPFVRGKIENAQFYFDAKNKNRLADLDLLLLSQGWSKYNWSTIFKQKINNYYKFENGINVTFSLNKKLSKNQALLIIYKKNNFIIQLKNNQLPFFAEKLFLEKDSDFQFGLQTRNTILKISPNISYSSSSIIDLFDKEKYSSVENNKIELSVFKPLQNNNVLDEVVVIANKKFENKIINSWAASHRKLELKNLFYNGTSLDEIVQSIFERYKYSRFPLSQIYLNENNITRELFQVYGYSELDVRELRLGTEMRNSPFPVRTLYIYTYSLKERRARNKNYNTLKIPIGFAKSKEYYSPRYPSFNQKTYKNYGAIFWKSNIIVKPNANFEIKIPKNYQKKITIFIEGLSENGKLIEIKN